MKKIGIGMLVLAVFLNAAATTLIRQTNPILYTITRSNP